MRPPLAEDRAVPGRDPRRVILTTCITHGGTPGFTNVVLTKRSGSIVMDSHATGACVLVLDQDAATAVRDTLTEWLG